KKIQALMRQTALFIFAAILLSAPAAPAAGAAGAAAEEPVSFTVTPPAGKILLTESFRFKVEASLPESYFLKPDTATAGGPDFEVLSFTRAGETKKDGRKTETFEINARAFTLGVSTFPAITWRLGGAEVQPGAEAASPAFNLEVLPLFKTKEGEGIRDIYPPFRYIPWPWLLALALAVAAAIFAYRMRARGGAAASPGSAWLDLRTPYQRGRDRLEKLEKSPLIADGRLKEFYTGLTAILRLYLAEEFSIDAALMTTSALGRELKKTGADIKTALRAREFLQKSDLVKFARLRPEDAGDDARDLAELLMEFQRAAENAKLLAARAMEFHGETRAAENARALAAAAAEQQKLAGGKP
ncbi:MAG: hypothetical protein Q7R35_07240, partial [Elusimicrobiota bacterium]|nr:hypothetical protein [Elusimicrobiota bacterium]